MFGICFSRVLTTIILLKLTSFRLLPGFDFIGLRSVLSFGTKMSAAQIVWYIGGNIDGVLIGRILGNDALGLYSVAYNLAMLPANKIMSLSNQIAFAAYSRIQDERVRASKYFQESVVLASLAFFRFAGHVGGRRRPRRRRARAKMATGDNCFADCRSWCPVPRVRERGKRCDLRDRRTRSNSEEHVDNIFYRIVRWSGPERSPGTSDGRDSGSPSRSAAARSGCPQRTRPVAA